MYIRAIKTRAFLPPQDNLFDLLEESLSKEKIKEKSIIAITSKVISIGQGRCLKVGSVSKEDLIKREADLYLDTKKYPNK